MKKEYRPIWTARDNSEHASEEACDAHEQALDHKALVGLADGDVAKALNRASPEDVELCGVLERVGEEAKHARKAAGGSKRKAQREAPHLRERRAATG